MQETSIIKLPAFFWRFQTKECVLRVNEVDVYIKEKIGSKYLVLNSASENNEVLKKYNELRDGIKNEIEIINNAKASKHSSAEYDNDFMKIKFNFNDNLPLNKILNLHNITVAIRSVFEDYGKFYLQVYLGECLYEL